MVFARPRGVGGRKDVELLFNRFRVLVLGHEKNCGDVS